jgi:hypothetical protein
MRQELDRIERRLTSEKERVLAYFDSLTDRDWDQQIYTTGSRWRARHLLAHFVSAERAFVVLLQVILAGGEGTPPGFDIDDFNESEVSGYDTSELQRLLEQFAAAREQVISLVQVMKPTDLQLTGRHPWFGDTTIGDMLKLIYRHNMIHLRDLRRAMSTKAPVPHLDVSPPASAGD